MVWRGGRQGWLVVIPRFHTQVLMGSLLRVSKARMVNNISPILQTSKLLVGNRAGNLALQSHDPNVCGCSGLGEWRRKEGVIMPWCSGICRPPGLSSPPALLLLREFQRQPQVDANLGWWSMVLPFQQERKHSTQTSNQGRGGSEGMHVWHSTNSANRSKYT